MGLLKERTKEFCVMVGKSLGLNEDQVYCLIDNLDAHNVTVKEYDFFEVAIGIAEQIVEIDISNELEIAIYDF